MQTSARPPHLLVLRPYFSSYSRDGAYAHVEALVMTRQSAGVPARYADLGYLHRHDDVPRPIMHEEFRYTCQIDDRSDVAYGERYGYTPESENIITSRDLARHGKSLTAFDKGMRRLDNEEGRTESLGAAIARVARVLRTDGIALLEVRTADHFGERHAVRRTASAPQYGAMIADIDRIVTELHRSCAARVGRPIAA